MVRRVPLNHVFLGALGMLISACGSSTPNPTPTTAPAPVVSAIVVASAAPATSISPAASAEPTPMAPSEPVASQAVIEAANRARGEITSLPSELKGEPNRDCLGDVCIWNFGFSARAKNGKDGIFGVIGIDEKSLAATFRTGNSDPIPISVYVVVVKREDAVVKAAAVLPEVKRLCANSSRQGAPCTMYSDQMPTVAPCPANPAPTDGCLWSVYVGSNMGSHLSRLATVYVDPSSAKVIGISDLACPPISPAAFRAREVRRAAKPPPDDDHYCD